jgi:hypothetical protein
VHLLSSEVITALSEKAYAFGDRPKEGCCELSSSIGTFVRLKGLRIAFHDIALKGQSMN